MREMHIHRISTVVGIITVVYTDKGVRQIDLPVCSPICSGRVSFSQNHGAHTLRHKSPVWLLQLTDDIRAYFQGRKISFCCPLDHDGLSCFAQAVYTVMQCIPYGATASYKDIAALSGYDRAVRAAGSVCRKNPVPVIIPCHRVIGSNGRLGGFSRGMAWKIHLLRLEQRTR